LTGGNGRVKRERGTKSDYKERKRKENSREGGGDIKTLFPLFFLERY